ncbi:MAG: multiheme c-type cytochrome, partial [Thermoguttaceae bacterium]
DNNLAEVVEGAQAILDVHAATPGRTFTHVDGRAFAYTGCQQCHGSKVAFQSTGDGTISVTELKPDADGQPTNKDAVAGIKRNDDGKPLFFQETWPNTGIGRLNLDGSIGACSACHSRHDFSPRRARQPENCGKCHLGPDHPQKEVYEESKHGIAYRDLKDKMNLDADNWVLGKDYTAAPTCATCHMSGNTRNKGQISHDPGLRISWTNRPPISLVMDTNAEGEVVKETDPEKRRELVVETAAVKRNRMKDVCSHCHTPDYINGFYKQYDSFVVLYNEKFGKPSTAIKKKLDELHLLTPMPFDEKLEWTDFYLWHHEGRRARHGASMMAPDYAHWHGTFEVAERFYEELIPQARQIIAKARKEGKTAEADAVESLIEEILARPEHQWYEKERKAEPADSGGGGPLRGTSP